MRFSNTPNKIFSKKLFATLTGKDAILKEVRDCGLCNDEDRLREISPYIYSYWRALSVKHGCLCIDERIAIPPSNQRRCTRGHSLHASWKFCNAVSSRKNLMATYPQRKASKCKACTQIFKNLKPVVSLQQMVTITKVY